ncbi:hypothetical protein PFICI_07568 [Pestalotiopsis fici W106-1]|uniref:RING-type E3 ubiquitin transferase n=1 Tax=Pestalotiopsis fici (strain W106-1 / CGMCC3.15140) TaxID=1229662 RepID=W3X1Z7_PESFW|nr:uncharacterized protein PFICI_07568 [Pestalotiopsis fici W106-1]ETS80039.1 hypothetical protein PFICI_07568 [Pestalotiopsis fici W106-1]
MRLLWYAGSSAALAVGVVTYAFNQRANFYSAMVYLSQNNLSLMILINLILLVYGTFVYGLQRVCYGQLRPVEIEQLYEKAWFAVTETCLAMTIFREEVGAWFLVMFTALVTGKVWEWIGEGRVEILEQQPPANPRLFHTRLSISLLLSIIYDTWLFSYTINTVIQQARPNMMVMFLFEFAILSTCSFRTGLRYILSLVEMNIVSKQTRTRLEERRKEVREQRADILRRRESGDAAESEAANQEELPNEEDIDEMDIEVPGWETKGQWVLSLDLFADFVKLGVYVGFFVVLMMFYGLPIHIMRDLFLTTRSFLKRLGALVKYRKALADMNKYPDATQDELEREDTCIICREEMRPWDAANPGAVERSRPKKLPCGHILHLGCLKGWLERQQVCPTCRRSVVVDGAAPNGDGAARPNADGQAPAPGAPGAVNGAADGNQGEQGRQGGMRMFQFGPLRLGFAQGNPQRVQELLQQRFNVGLDGAPAPLVPPQPGVAQQPHPAPPSNNTATDIGVQLQELQQRLQQELLALQLTQAELQTTYALMAELQRLRLYQQHQQVVNNALGLPVQSTPAINGQGLQPPNHFPAIPPTMASFPPIPQRVQTPTLSRHIASANTAAIPAGSPDLPEGVVIPQGWTLMPLQRMDGQAHPFSHPSSSHTETAQHSQAQQAPYPFNHETATTSAGPAQSTSQANPTPEDESTTSRDSEAQRESPQVAAPTPRLPNWGGAAQLFSNGGVGTTSAHAAESSAEGAENHEAHEDHEDTDITDKGKAKAVTVEDTEDSDD